MDLENLPPTSSIDRNTLPPKKMKSSKKKKVLLLALLIVLLAALAGGGYWWLNRDKSQPAASTPGPTKPEIEQTIADVTQAVTTTYSFMSVKQNMPDYEYSFVYKPAGSDDYMVSDGKTTQGVTFQNNTSSNAELDNSAATEKQNNDVRAFAIRGLETQGFTKIDDKLIGSQDTSTKPPISLQSSGGTLVCTVGTANAATFDFSCATKDNLDAQTAASKPFMEAYRHDSKDTSVNTVISIDKIKDSKTSGYKLMTGGVSDVRTQVGGAAALFYQTPDGTWHFFTATQSVLPCSDYNTDDLRKAYLGENCIKDGSAKMQKVTL